MANFSYDYKSNKTISGTSGWDVLTLTTRDVNGLGYFGDAYFEGNDLILVSAQDPSVSLRVVNQLTTGNIEQITYFAANGAYATYSLRIGSIDTDMSAAEVAYDIFGTNADDSIYVGELHSEASGSGGDDVLVGGAGDNYLVGGRDNDKLFGGDGDDWLYGDEFRDAFALIYNSSGDDYLNGGRGNDNLFGSAGSDRLIGGSGTDKLYGGTGNDSLRGDSGNDTLYGDTGADTLTGGTGSDLIYGGADNVQDVFIFKTVAESKTGSTRDKVYDFRTKVDDLDLQGIDANTTLTGDQKFGFGTMTAKANSVWYKLVEFDGDATTKEIIVYGDVNGDAKADFEIGLMGVTSVIKGDFIL
jgi:Ca2+-binding RTX toxin-like protein